MENGRANSHDRKIAVVDRSIASLPSRRSIIEGSIAFLEGRK